MELQPASSTLFETLRSGSDGPGGVVPPLSPSAPAAEPRPVANHRISASCSQPMPADEVLIPDYRAGLTPAQSVERKLTILLRGGAIAASHFRLAKLNRRR